MKAKNRRNITRRSFLSDTGKTLFYSSLATSAISHLLAGCNKTACNQLKIDNSGSHYCDDYYVCIDSLGFSCPQGGDFNCGTDLFSCNEKFSCDPANSFSCLPDSSFTDPKGGAGG